MKSNKLEQESAIFAFQELQSDFQALGDSYLQWTHPETWVYSQKGLRFKKKKL